MRVAAVQHDIVWEDRAANFARLAPMIAAAAGAGARLVLLSEMFSVGFSMDTTKVSEPLDGPSADFLAEQAARHDCWVGGSIPEVGPGDARPANSFVLASPSGARHRYAKIHPFTYAREHEAYRAGEGYTTVDIDGIRTSLFVCYDLRFADDLWAVARDTDLYLVPANWPDSRRHHWRSLLVARAIENQAYVIGCNRVGTAAKLRYCGDSMIVDPMGETLASAAGGESILLADIDRATVQATREHFPFLADRRT